MNPASLTSLRQAFDDPGQISQSGCEFCSAVQPAENDIANELANPESTRGMIGLVELILKDPARLERLIRQPDQQIELLPRFLAISFVAFVFFGVAMTLIFGAAAVWPHLFPLDQYLEHPHSRLFSYEADQPVQLLTPWLNGNAFRLTIAYAVGLIAATGICLPSLYFYGLLAGVRMTAMDVVIHAVKSKAVGAVMLLGVLPIYAPWGLAIAIFSLPIPARDSLLFIGLILPFLAGLAATASLYRGLSGMIDTMPVDRRPYRECFLRRLVLSWAAVYSAVTPVLIYTLWQKLQG